MALLQKMQLVNKKKILQGRATFLASKMRTTEEKALRASLKAEEARAIYRNIKDSMGKTQSFFTQVDISSYPTSPSSSHVTFASQEDIERHILESFSTILGDPLFHRPNSTQCY
jgi:hypothetical protein